MQRQTSSELPARSGTSSPGRWVSSVSQLGTGTWIALLLTCFSWFALDTLRVQWGPLKQDVHFYDMADVIGHPARLFTGLDANRGGPTTALFILLCVAALLAPVALHACRHRLAWLGWFAPLAMMVCVALLLWARTSGDLFRESAGGDTLGNDVRHFANHLFRGASAAIAQQVRGGVGGYLALASSTYLAWCAIVRLRNRPALDREPG